VPSLDWELKDGDIAHIKLYQFTEKASGDFKAAAVDIINSPAKAIILDLRNNPGGYLSVAQDIAGWFLKKGEIITRESFGERYSRRPNTNPPVRRCWKISRRGDY